MSLRRTRVEATLSVWWWLARWWLLRNLHGASGSPHFPGSCIWATKGGRVIGMRPETSIPKEGLGLLISRRVVENGVHLILKHGDPGRFRDVKRTRALGSQGLAAKVKSFIWGAGRHVDQGEEIDSSTEARQKGPAEPLG